MSDLADPLTGQWDRGKAGDYVVSSSECGKILETPIFLCGMIDKLIGSTPRMVSTLLNLVTL